MSKRSSELIEQASERAYGICKDNGIEVEDIEVEWSSIMATHLVELVVAECINIIAEQEGYTQYFHHLPDTIRKKLGITS